MKFSTPTSRVSKGQLKCHDCRSAVLIKEGNWRDRGTQQVFLCKTCDKVRSELQPKVSSNH